MCRRAFKRIQAYALVLAILAAFLPAFPIFASDEQVIYRNDFETDAAAVDIGGNKALEFTVAGDPANSWVTVFQQDLLFEYADPIYSGAVLSFDLILPESASYTGVLKAQAVTKMGSEWTWTQSGTIPEISIKDFKKAEKGYKKVEVSIPFGPEIEAQRGLRSVVPCLAASNCDYNGRIYLDNVKLVNGKPSQNETELPAVEPIIFTFDNKSDLGFWSDGGSYDYSGGLKIGYDSELKAMRLDLDYSKNATSSWSEAKVMHTFAKVRELEGYNQFSFDFIYDPSNMSSGSFTAKVTAGIIDANTAVTGEVDFGNGLKKASVVISFASAPNQADSFIIGLAGNNTDYRGPIYIDNVMFSQRDILKDYVTATIPIEKQTPIRVSENEITANGQTMKVSSTVRLVDDKAADYTVKLAAYLDAVGKTDSVLFGHQNDITHKSGNRSLSNSDTKDVTGTIAAVMGLDVLSLTGNELASAPWNAPLADRIAACEAVTKEAADQGAIITLSAHMPNFEVIHQRVKNSMEGTADPSDSNSVGILSDGHYNFSGYTPGVLTGDIVTRIMPGQDLNYLYTDYLDMIAAYAKALEDDNISVLFRPFHEGTGSWFWWGKAFCDAEAFKNVYRYTVEYLRDVKGVHNFIYVYGPGSEAESIEEYELRYPGDDYVDMVGFDMYHSSPAEGDNFIEQFKKQLAIVGQFATEHNKLFAVTETGVANGSQALLKKGNQRKDWYNEILEAVAPTNASYFLLWANFGENTSIYTPYVVSRTDNTIKGHEMLDNFIDFYNDPRTVFAAQVGDYTKISATAAKNTKVTGYFTAPVSGSRILEQTSIEASIRNAPDQAVVKFVAKNKTGDAVQEIKAVKGENGRYTGTLTAEKLATLGKSAGTMALVVDGEVYSTINLKYNQPAPVIEPTVVDTFEDYYGDSDILNSVWSVGRGPGCSVIPELTQKRYDGKYALKFRYNLIPGGYAGITKSMNGADWSSKNALQLWTISDGKRQRVVIQVTSGSNVFEVYLNNYEQYNYANRPLLVTIPFSSFVGRDNPAAVFDPSNIQSFGLWCNTIVPEGADEDTYTLSSVLYYDSIKAVSSDAQTVTFEEATVYNAPAAQQTKEMIELVKQMNLKRGTTRLLTIKLEIVSEMLGRKNPTLALAGLKSFMLHVKLAEGSTISSDKVETLLAEAEQLYNDIIYEHPEMNLK